jgi:hypothetical protein
MLSKACASWLVVLVLLPFTAPFSTFDPTDFLPAPSHRAVGTPSSRTSTAALTHAVLSRAVALPPRVGRLRLTLTRPRALHAAAAAPVAAPARSGAFPIQIVHPPSRPTVLRI